MAAPPPGGRPQPSRATSTPPPQPIVARTGLPAGPRIGGQARSGLAAGADAQGRSVGLPRGHAYGPLRASVGVDVRPTRGDEARPGPVPVPREPGRLPRQADAEPSAGREDLLAAGAPHDTPAGPPSGTVAGAPSRTPPDAPPDAPTGAPTPEAVAVPPESEAAPVRAALERLQNLPPDDPERLRLRQHVVESHLPLVRALAQRYRDLGEPLDDLVQIGTIGLIQAVDRFDPARGTGLASYATPNILGEIRRHFRDRAWAVKVPRRLQELQARTSAARQDLAQRLGRSPTVAELAKALDLEEEAVLEGLDAQRAYAAVPLERPEGQSELDGALVTVDSALEEVVDRESLRPVLRALPARDKRILALRYFRGLSQAQIADELGISQMHVSRLLARTLAQLQQCLADAGEAGPEAAPKDTPPDPSRENRADRGRALPPGPRARAVDGGSNPPSTRGARSAAAEAGRPVPEPTTTSTPAVRTPASGGGGNGGRARPVPARGAARARRDIPHAC